MGEIVPMSPASSVRELERQAFERYAADHAPEWAPDEDALREMRYIASYPQLWGVMRTISRSYHAGGWAYWVGWFIVASYLSGFGLRRF